MVPISDIYLINYNLVCQDRR